MNNYADAQAVPSGNQATICNQPNPTRKISLILNSKKQFVVLKLHILISNNKNLEIVHMLKLEWNKNKNLEIINWIVWKLRMDISIPIFYFNQYIEFWDVCPQLHK